MPGMAMYKEPTVFASEQANIDKWFALTHKKVQNWLYICWPEDRTKAPFLYPHVVQRYYQVNREKTVGSFINGGGDHYPRQAVTLYAWMKCLWNPDYNVDAAIDEYCTRMFGAAANAMRELIQLQIDGWEKSRFPNASLSDQAVLVHAYPTKTRLRMKMLLARSKYLAWDDDLTLQRIAYYEAPLKEFLAEAGDAASAPKQSLVAKRVADDPKIDGKLDEDVWKRAEPASFVRAYDRQNRTPKCATTIKAVWSPRGVTFGFAMSDPQPYTITHDVVGRDNEHMWWNDCVELLLDPSGKNQGDFYHFIVTAAGQICDFHGVDINWNSKGIKTAAAIGKDGWSCEVFVPFDDFPGAVIPKPGEGGQWFGNFTRHRIGPTTSPVGEEGDDEDYQRLNTTYAHHSANLADFGPILFRD
jgi:hypothetical protein